MKRTRMAITSLLVLLIIVLFFFFYNRPVNQLKNDHAYPMVEEPNQHPQPVTSSSLEIEDTGVHLTKFYSRNSSEGLFLGMWYGKGNNLMNNEEKNWERKNGHIEFLVKAVDSNGTTYNGKTIGTKEGTFSVFRYIQFDDFHYDQHLEKLTLAFYPMINNEKNVPNKHAWMEVTIPVK